LEEVFGFLIRFIINEKNNDNLLNKNKLDNNNDSIHDFNNNN
jgi:hypothetical protein